MFSNADVRTLLAEFVLLKVDPRSGGIDQEVFRFKSTRFVPEVVLLSPRGEVLRRLEDRSVPGAIAVLKDVLAQVGPRKT